jgi:alanyl-tRNA synthetase
MTLKRYLYEPTLGGSAVITEIGSDEQFWIRLNQTWFHPQGGGQKADKGTVDDIPVIHVAHFDGEVNHYVEMLTGLEIGKEVSLKVDPGWRRTNAKSHTAGHLIAAIAESLFPGIKAVSGHHWPGEARVEFSGKPLPTADEVLKRLSDALSQAIGDGLPVEIIGDPLVSRSIQIGEFSAVPCGGTHLENLDSLDEVELTKVKIKSGKLRVSYQT